MSDDDIEQRLATASDRLAGLGSALQEGGPWPMATRFDHSPEAAWGPPEILAHLAEMLPYWLGEAERILDSGELASFGRLPTDEDRLAVIARDRTLPIGQLVAGAQAGIARWRKRWAELEPADRERTGTHVTRGPHTVADIATRLVTGHMEDHLDQLTATLGGGSTPR